MYSSNTTGSMCPMKKLTLSLVKMKNGVGSVVRRARTAKQRTQSGQGEKKLGFSASFGGYEDYATMIENGH